MLRKILSKILNLSVSTSSRLLSPFRKSKYEEILEKTMHLAAGFRHEPPGDYLEFGSYKGESLKAAWKMAKRFELDHIRFYAFDSFQGLPAIKGVDAELRQFKAGMYKLSEKNFLSNLKWAGVDLSRVTVIPGWFHNTLNKTTKNNLTDLEKAAVIYVDCDLYESTVSVLDFITDYVVDGTIIVFDDWFCFKGNPNRGEQRAFREWLAKNPALSASEYWKYSFDGNSFILHLRNRTETSPRAMEF